MRRRARPGRLPEPGRQLAEPRLVDVERGHLRAGAEQAAHDLPPDPAGRPGHDGDPAFELHVHPCLPCRFRHHRILSPRSSTIRTLARETFIGIELPMTTMMPAHARRPCSVRFSSIEVPQPGDRRNVSTGWDIPFPETEHPFRAWPDR